MNDQYTGPGGHNGNGRSLPLVRESREDLSFSVNREVFVSREILEREQRAVFDRCWVYVGHASEVRNPGDFKTRSRRRPAGDLLPRPRRAGALPDQFLPPSRLHRVPRARGQCAQLLLHVSRLDLQHRRHAAQRAGRGRLSAELRQVRHGARGGAAVRILLATSISRISIATPSISKPISPAPRTISTSSSTSRRRAAWRSSPACRNTTSRRTGSCWSRTASTTITWSRRMRPGSTTCAIPAST